MGRNLKPLELFTITFLEALPFRIWNLMIKTGDGQTENEDDLETREHFKENRPKFLNSYQASSARICHADRILLSSNGLSRTVSTSHIDFEHCAQRRARGEIVVPDLHHVKNFDKFSNFRAMAQTWEPFKLLTHNFLEPLAFRIWIRMIQTWTGQKEKPNDRQTFAHTSKTWIFWTKKIAPYFTQIGHRR